MKHKGLLIAIIIAIFGFIYFFVKMSSAPPAPTHKTLQQQMQKDPSTWNSAEQKNYNDYLEWQSKQTP